MKRKELDLDERAWMASSIGSAFKSPVKIYFNRKQHVVSDSIGQSNEQYLQGWQVNPLILGEECLDLLHRSVSCLRRKTEEHEKQITITLFDGISSFCTWNELLQLWREKIVDHVQLRLARLTPLVDDRHWPYKRLEQVYVRSREWKEVKDDLPRIANFSWQ